MYSKCGAHRLCYQYHYRHIAEPLAQQLLVCCGFQRRQLLRLQGATAAIATIDLSFAVSSTYCQSERLEQPLTDSPMQLTTLSNITTNTAGSRSRIQDTDYAVAAAELARTQIIQQAGTAMLAQANQAPQSVLALLK
jgi:hypothetical protein